MGVTGKDIAEKTLYAIECKGGYIWGKAGIEWTDAKQDQLEAAYKSDPEKYSNYKQSARYGRKWVGHRVWDCSGLTRWAALQFDISFPHGSNSMYYKCRKKGKMTKDTELPIGAYVFTGDSKSHGHIGTYTGDGKVTEAASTIDGCIQSDLHNKKWTYWGIGPGIEYEFVPGEQPGPAPEPGTKHKTLRKGDRGAEVKEMQELLLKHGEKLVKYGADGVFGNETLAAVKSFQKKAGIGVDGICGPITWGKLLEEE